MHKRMFIALLAAILLSACSQSKTETVDRAHLYRMEERIREEQESADSWQGIAVCFAFGGVLLLLVGTAIGSKTRRDANRTKH